VDVTQARQREQELEHKALFDTLTGLPNRTLLGERFRRASEPPCHRGAFLMIDLDGFKLINDQLGHSAGDDVLIAVARRLSHQLPAGSTISRLGGDEFAVLLPDTTDDVAGKLAIAVCESIAEPFPGIPRRVTASVGVTALGSLENTLRQADLAMYAAKSAGRNRAVVYGSNEFRVLEAALRDTTSGLSALTAERDRLHLEARTDALTGLANRRALDELMETFTGPVPASVLFIDLDRFGAFNHRHGDQAGDEALRAVARVLAAQCRDEDHVFRKGGEEFTVVLPGRDAGAAQAAAERLRATIEGLGLEHHGADDTPVVTLTVGAATREDHDLAQALSDASDAAFACKVAGTRNRVATATS
jgi:diguanylate cyclase (GGDEF)-like protein